LIALLAFAAFAATPANADVTVVRWNSGMCQIWDNAAGPPPWPTGEFVRVAGGFPEWGAAWAAMNELYASGKCGWAAVAPAPQPVLALPPPPVAPPPGPAPWLLPPPPWAVTR
jgi:hypothetical protein